MVASDQPDNIEPEKLAGEVLAGGGRLVGHDDPQGVVIHREILRGARHDFAVYVDRELRLRLEPHPLGPVVVHAFQLDEVPALEVASDPEQGPGPAQLYGQDVEPAVVYARFGGDDYAPAVETPLPTARCRSRPYSTGSRSPSGKVNRAENGSCSKKARMAAIG